MELRREGPMSTGLGKSLLVEEGICQVQFAWFLGSTSQLSPLDHVCVFAHCERTPGAGGRVLWATN